MTVFLEKFIPMEAQEGTTHASKYIQNKIRQFSLEFNWKDSTLNPKLLNSNKKIQQYNKFKQYETMIDLNKNIQQVSGQNDKSEKGYQHHYTLYPPAGVDTREQPKKVY